jgi:carbonic anhydrase
MFRVSDEEFAGRLEAETGERPGWSPESYGDLEESVRDSIRRIEDSPFIPNKSSVRGFVYDVKTGELTEVT